MSFKHTALVLDFGPVDALEKVLLMALTDRADASGVCWPSRADLEARTNISSATLTRKLRRLVDAGWLQRQRRFNSSNVFRVNFARLERLAAEASAAKVAEVPFGFEAFEDEKPARQVIENKGTDHCEHTSDHCEHTSDHCEHTSDHCDAPNLSLNRPINLKAPSDLDLKKKAGALADGLSPFVKTSLLQGKSVLVNGEMIDPLTPLGLALVASIKRVL